MPSQNLHTNSCCPPGALIKSIIGGHSVWEGVKFIRGLNSLIACEQEPLQAVAKLWMRVEKGGAKPQTFILLA